LTWLGPPIGGVLARAWQSAIGGFAGVRGPVALTAAGKELRRTPERPPRWFGLAAVLASRLLR